MDKRYYSWISLGSLLLIICILTYSGMGFIKIPTQHIIDIVFNPNSKFIDSTEWYIIREVRLPRILVSASTGAILSLSGLLFQGVLLNPLADSYTLGISSGASFGAALAIILNLSLFGSITVQIIAFVFALLCLSIVLKIASFNGKYSSISLILAGIISGAFFSAGLSFIKYLLGDDVGSIVFWLMGSFTNKTWNEFFILLIILLVGLIISKYFSEELNIMSLGEKNAQSMGIETDKIRKILLITASILSAVCVSICGIIGFVGLIIPHSMRFAVGTDNRKLVFSCALWGAILMVSADNIVRAVLPNEIPIGVITALLGAPFFTFIFRKKLGNGGRIS